MLRLQAGPEGGTRRLCCCFFSWRDEAGWSGFRGQGSGFEFGSPGFENLSGLVEPCNKDTTAL